MIIFIGIASAFLILPPNRVIRGDGTIVKLEAASHPREEIIGMGRLLKDWRMLGMKITHISCARISQTSHLPCSSAPHVLRLKLFLRLPRRC